MCRGKDGPAVRLETMNGLTCTPHWVHHFLRALRNLLLLHGGRPQRQSIESQTLDHVKLYLLRRDPGMLFPHHYVRGSSKSASKL